MLVALNADVALDGNRRHRHHRRRHPSEVKVAMMGRDVSARGGWEAKKMPHQLSTPQKSMWRYKHLALQLFFLFFFLLCVDYS